MNDMNASTSAPYTMPMGTRAGPRIPSAATARAKIVPNSAAAYTTSTNPERMSHSDQAT
jgi:hypothetical protein